MKRVEAAVRKAKFEEVDQALKKIGVPGVTVVDGLRAGRGMWNYPLEHVSRVHLTVIVEDSSVERVVNSIRDSASTRSQGDGSISVSTVDQVLDIGSGLCDKSELATPFLGV